MAPASYIVVTAAEERLDLCQPAQAQRFLDIWRDYKTAQLGANGKEYLLAQRTVRQAKEAAAGDKRK